jgi:O-acetyl-ADP-ribose deacetylase (regulator of RNase III)
MITYLKGDATVPQAKGTKLIVHVCNTLGGWGAGFVLAISKRWEQPEAMYRRWYHQRKPIQNTEPGEIVMTSGKFELGQTQLIMVADRKSVV